MSVPGTFKNRHTEDEIRETAERIIAVLTDTKAKGPPPTFYTDVWMLARFCRDHFRVEA